MRSLFFVLAALFALLLSTSWAAPADGPTWSAAPHELVERPEVDAPEGGWWTESGPLVTVHADESDRAVARKLADHAARSLPALAERLGVPAGKSIDVYIAPTQEAFDRIQPGIPPDWADGTAYSRLGLIFLRTPGIRPGTASPLEQVLDHELVHVLLGTAFGPRPVPRWLQEGLAQYYAGEIKPDDTDKIARGLIGNGLFHLQDLVADFPVDASRAQLAYTQSADFAGWMAMTYGEGSHRTLIDALSAGRGVDTALREATGADMQSLDEAWRSRLTTPVNWFRGVASSGLFWLIPIGALAYGWRWRRQRNQARMARWEEDERREDERIAAVRRVQARRRADDAYLN